jgi:bifunctional UDP-N-acetylglucosamine pyrophosphorylase/glucosamine-1-phosphate N-acetyltransferase
MAKAVGEAVILAAGEGTRLRPLTYRRPKVLIPIANLPFLGHQLHLLEQVGIDKVVLIAGYMRDRIVDWLAEWEGSLEVQIVVQEEARGTGDAIGKARDSVSGPFLVMNGDVLIDRESLAAMVGSGRVSVSAKRVDNPQDYGVFELHGGSVKRVAEKAHRPPSDLANVGVYLFEPDVFDRIDATPPNPTRREVEITDTLQAMVDSGRQLGCREVDEWHELGKPWDIVKLNEILIPRTPADVARDADLGGDVDPGVAIGRGTVVEKGSRVLGPSVIGSDCWIGRGSVIGPFCSIGDRTSLRACMVEGSVLMKDCQVGEGSAISCSTLGDGVMVKDRVTFLADSGDSSTIKFKIKDRIYDSERVRMGPIVGDGSRIGEGVVLRPATMLDPDSVIPGS